MRQFFTPVLAVALLGLASCQKDASTTPSAALEGTWQLTGRQCYCPAGPVPDEKLVFSGQQVVYYKNGQVVRTGEYAITTAASACLGGSGTPAPALRITYPPSNIGPTVPQYILAGNTLTLDYGGPCDAPVDTYVRLQ